jgi:hypothetical protein
MRAAARLRYHVTPSMRASTFIQDRSASGKRDSSAQRQTAQNRLQARNGSSRRPKRRRKSPPIAGFSAVSGKSAGSKDCVVGPGDLAQVSAIKGLCVKHRPDGALSALAFLGECQKQAWSRSMMASRIVHGAAVFALVYRRALPVPEPPPWRGGSACLSRPGLVLRPMTRDARLSALHRGNETA